MCDLDPFRILFRKAVSPIQSNAFNRKGSTKVCTMYVIDMLLQLLMTEREPVRNRPKKEPLMHLKVWQRCRGGCSHR